MYKLSRGKILAILFVCVAGILYAAPNFFKNKDMMPEWWRPVNLGLDLQGGSYLLLEVKTDDVIKERMSSLEDSVRSSLRENKLRYQKLSYGENYVKVKIDSSSSKSTAMANFRKLDDGLEVSEDDNGFIVISYSDMALNELKVKIVSQSIEIVRRRIDEVGTKEPIIQRQGSDRILVQLPGLENPEYVKELLGKTAKMSFHLVDSRTSASDARMGRIASSSRLVKGTDGTPYVIERKVAVGGENLIDAQPSFQEMGEVAVSFKFDAMGGKRFAEVTKNNVGERLAIVLDNEVISAPTIQGAIPGGSGVITGSFSVQEANDLALLLRAGALPAPLEVLEERTVGAGLGADSINAGVIASIVGLLFIVVFMVAAYGLFGIFTTIALVVNICLLIAALGFLGATLTLPGIAGMILTLAMAVDANVLIFERMREEVKKGRSPRDGADVGFTEAWRTIVDSNLTTLIAGIVLFYFGTGPIRGFAVTLSIGILTSIFTSVTVTRVIISTWLTKYKPTKLPID